MHQGDLVFAEIQLNRFRNIANRKGKVIPGDFFMSELKALRKQGLKIEIVRTDGNKVLLR